MTVPRGAPTSLAGSLADMVRGMMPHMRRSSLTADDLLVAVYLRGNDNLFEGLNSLIRSRIEGRANSPVPSNPQECMASMAADKELRWLLSKLELIYRSSPSEPADEDSEQPV